MLSSVQNLGSSSLVSEHVYIYIYIYIYIKAYRTMIFPIVLYVCETWSLTLREECSTPEKAICHNPQVHSFT